MKNRCVNINHDYGCDCGTPKKKVLVIGAPHTGKSTVYEAIQFGLKDVVLYEINDSTKGLSVLRESSQQAVDAMKKHDNLHVIYDQWQQPISKRTINRQNKPKTNKYGQIRSN